MNFPTPAHSTSRNSLHRIEIKKIVAQREIETHFQPLVSIKQQTIIGVEALTRGIHEFDGRLILPATLFRLAAAEDVLCELDAVCRQRAVENFALLRTESPQLLLFLNCYIPTLDGAPVSSLEIGHDLLLKLLEEQKVLTNSLVLEVLESRFHNPQELQSMAAQCKEQGLLVALNGMGSSQSNLNRVTTVRPDLLKIDKSLIAQLDHAPHQQELFKALVQLARRSGALVVAEGIENEQQAIIALELGADLLQGFYFSRPQSLSSLDFTAIQERIESVAARFKQHMLAKINHRKGQHRSYNVILNSILAELSRVGVEQFDTRLAELIARYPSIECAYVLDDTGRQVSETVCNRQFHKPLEKSHLFHPSPRGADHSLQEYFYLLLDVELNKFTTEPYVSLSTGNLCTTISTLFRDAHNNHMFILCIDVGAEAARPTR